MTVPMSPSFIGTDHLIGPVPSVLVTLYPVYWPTLNHTPVSDTDKYSACGLMNCEAP
jgi:hypothetical protein